MRLATPVGIQLRRLQRPTRFAADPASHRGRSDGGHTGSAGRLRRSVEETATGRRVGPRRGHCDGSRVRDRDHHRPGRPIAAGTVQAAEARVGPEPGHRHCQRGRRPVVQPRSAAQTPPGEDLETLRRHRRIATDIRSCK